jgi:hypothetical protein
MLVVSGRRRGLTGALMSTAVPHEWFDGTFVPAIARQA